MNDFRERLILAITPVLAGELSLMQGTMREVTDAATLAVMFADQVIETMRTVDDDRRELEANDGD